MGPIPSMRQPDGAGSWRVVPALSGRADSIGRALALSRELGAALPAQTTQLFALAQADEHGGIDRETPLLGLCVLSCEFSIRSVSCRLLVSVTSLCDAPEAGFRR